MYEHLIRFIIRRPIPTIVATLVVTAWLAQFIPTLTLQTDIDSFIPPDDPAVSNQAYMESIFGKQDLVMVAITRTDHPDGVYQTETLALISEVTDWLATRPEFETALSSDLRALPTANNILADEDGLSVQPFMERPPETREAALAIRDAMAANPIFDGTLASKDGKAAMILVRESALGHDTRPSAYYALQTKLDEYREQGRPEKFYIAGMPVVQGLFTIYIPGEARRMLPAVLTMVAVFLFAAFRTLRGVLVPMTILLTTELWMLGFHALLGRPFYTVSSILPVLIIAISVADSIHLLARYYDAQVEYPAADRDFIVAHTMREMGPPVMMTSITTAVGFLSMYTTRIPPLQDFGTTISFGILAAFALTLVFIPAFLAVLPLKPSPVSRDQEGIGAGAVHAFLIASSRWVLRNPRVVLTAMGGLVAVSLVGITMLGANSSLIDQFKPSHFLREADSVVNRHFAGSSILDIVLEGDSVDAFKDPEVLKKIDRLQAEIEAEPGVGGTMSIAEMIKRMNRMMHADDPEYEKIPDTRELVAQYLLLYSISGDPGDFDDLVDYDYQHARVMISLRDPGTHLARRVAARASEITAGLFDGSTKPEVHFRAAGDAYRFGRTELHVVRGQITSLLVCLPAMLVLNWLMFRSRTMALLAVLPVTLTVVIVYGSMGFIGLPLEIASVILSGMAIGIGIDFAIHYLFKYRLYRSQGLDHDAACERTTVTAGRALLFNAIVLFGGFIVLLAARFYPQVKLGSLVSATVLICYVSTIYLFPALLARVRSERFVVEAERVPPLRGAL